MATPRDDAADPAVASVDPPAVSEQAAADHGLTWGVGAVAERLGVAASTLRTWERRYGIGPSRRTHGGHRRYSATDIDRVELVRRLVGRGVAVQDAARVVRAMDLGELDRALRDSADELVDSSPSVLVDALMSSAVAVDTERLEHLVTQLIGRPGFGDTWSSVLSPFLRRLAAERSAGVLDAEVERMALASLVHGFEDRHAMVADARPAVVLLGSEATAEHTLPLYALQASLDAADVATELVGHDGLDDALAWTQDEDGLPDVVVLWSADGRDDSKRDLGAHRRVVSTGPAWPHEVRVRSWRGTDRPTEPRSTDVAGLADEVVSHIA